MNRWYFYQTNLSWLGYIIVSQRHHMNINWIAPGSIQLSKCFFKFLCKTSISSPSTFSLSILPGLSLGLPRQPPVNVTSTTSTAICGPSSTRPDLVSASLVHERYPSAALLLLGSSVSSFSSSQSSNFNLISTVDSLLDLNYTPERLHSSPLQFFSQHSPGDTHKYI